MFLRSRKTITLLHLLLIVLFSFVSNWQLFCQSNLPDSETTLFLRNTVSSNSEKKERMYALNNYSAGRYNLVTYKSGTSINKDVLFYESRHLILSDTNQTLLDSTNINLRTEKPYCISACLAVFPGLFTALCLEYNISSHLSLTVAYDKIGILLSYNGKGMYVETKMYLSPQTNLSTYVSLGLGPVWNDSVTGKDGLGMITITQFGLDYIDDFGTNLYGAIGPIVSLMPNRWGGGMLLQIGLGLRL